MNTKKFIVWSLLVAAVIVAVVADGSLDDKKEGAKEVEIPTVQGETEAKDNLNQENYAGVETVGEEEKDNNYEVHQGYRGGGWRGGGGGGGWRGGGGGWRGGGWRGGGWRGGGGGGGWRGGGWRGGGGGWRGGGGGWRGGGWSEGGV